MALPYADGWLMRRLAARYGASTSDLVLFYSPIGPWGPLASFHPQRFWLDGCEWPSAEHCFQAAKFVHRPDLFAAIHAAKSAFDAKAIAARNKHLRPRNWHAVRDGVMRRANEAKFGSSARLMRILTNTATRPIVEVAHEDRYWGCGPDGSGTNRAGELLMELRAAQVRRGNRYSCANGTRRSSNGH